MSKKKHTSSNKVRVPMAYHLTMDIAGDTPTVQDIKIFLALNDVAMEAKISFESGQIHARWDEKIKITLDSEKDHEHDDSSIVSDTDLADDDEEGPTAYTGFGFGRA